MALRRPKGIDLGRKLAELSGAKPPAAPAKDEDPFGASEDEDPFGASEDEDPFGPPNRESAATLGLSEPDHLGYMLGTTTDTLNETLETSEGQLGALNLGVSASVPLRDDEAPPTVWLAFRKVGSAWKLMVDTETGTDQWSCTELLTASRECRVAAATRLDVLYDALVQRAQIEIAAVRAAVESVAAFNQRIARRGAR